MSHEIQSHYLWPSGSDWEGKGIPSHILSHNWLSSAAKDAHKKCWTSYFLHVHLTDIIQRQTVEILAFLCKIIKNLDRYFYVPVLLFLRWGFCRNMWVQMTGLCPGFMIHLLRLWSWVSYLILYPRWLHNFKKEKKYNCLKPEN